MEETPCVVQPVQVERQKLHQPIQFVLFAREARCSRDIVEFVAASSGLDEIVHEGAIGVASVSKNSVVVKLGTRDNECLDSHAPQESE